MVQETDGEESYEDSSLFFAHIRNSITHSTFTIDYDEMFETSSLSKIKYHFEDFDSKNNQKYKTFEIDLYAEDIIKLIDIMKSNVNNRTLNKQKIDYEIDLDEIRDDLGIQRYNMKKYDSKAHPLPLRRPTNEEFETSVGDDRLLSGFSSNILTQLKDTKEKGNNDL